MSSIVEETLRAQRGFWQEISEGIHRNNSRDLPAEAPKRILLFGVGSSHFAAQLTAYAILRDRHRGRTPIIACQSTAIGLNVFPRSGDWAFGFSHRGKTEATIQALKVCEREGAIPILVAGRGAEELGSEIAHFTLATCPLEKVEAHTASVTGAICAVTTLLLGAKALEEWDAVRSLGDPSLDLMRERAGKGPALILGEWEGEWIARETNLKLIEMARSPAAVYSSEEFFHGPSIHYARETSGSESFPVWQIAVSGDSRASDISRLAVTHRVSITGGTPMAWIPALIEMQWMALAVALNRGVDPDRSP